MAKLKSTIEGLIYIKGSTILNIKRANSIDAAKILGKDVIINSDHIIFLGYNINGNVTYFMSNGLEISINVTHDEAEKAFISAKKNISIDII